MALLYAATLDPPKLDLLAAWLPTQDWAGDVERLEQVGAYRFDDPAGEVGLESFLLRSADGRLLHVPVTYRGAPLEGADEHLVGALDHSVLGRRWVYDGPADPVYVVALVEAVLNGGTEVEQVLEHPDGTREVRPPTVTVAGSGVPGSPVPAVDEVEIEVVRLVGAELAEPWLGTLTGSWGEGRTAVLAAVRRRVS